MKTTRIFVKRLTAIYDFLTLLLNRFVYFIYLLRSRQQLAVISDHNSNNYTRQKRNETQQ